jgi:flagellar hook-length control protein FliK
MVSGTAVAAKPLSDAAGGALFHGLLGGTVAGMLGSKQSAAAPSAQGTAVPADAELARALKEQLDRGTSLSDVVAKLASSLAASVAAQLGISPQAAQQRLTAAFTQALKPDDTGPPLSNAERASSLVARFRQIAELATRVANGDPGHTIRLIAGQRSDAAEAKANPAPQTDGILRDALTALAAPASPATEATTLVAPAVPPAVSTAGDGRTVALETPAQAIATGGDTPLGRIIARAVLAGDQRPVPVAAPILGASHGVTAPANVVTAPPLQPALNPTDLDAFVQAFASALARSDATAARGNGDAPSAAPADSATISGSSGSSAASSSVTTGQPVLSFAIPVVHDAAPVVPPAPPATLPQPQHVDANAVVDQIVRGMAIRTTDGQSEVRLRLVPENLGDVSVKLIVSGGSVNASITAHTAEAQTALAGGQNQLAKTLADAGLKLQSFTVGLAGGNFADAREQSRSNDPWSRANARRIGGVHSADTPDPDDLEQLAVSSIGPPIYSARSLPGNFNHLA